MSRSWRRPRSIFTIGDLRLDSTEREERAASDNAEDDALAIPIFVRVVIQLKGFKNKMNCGKPGVRYPYIPALIAAMRRASSRAKHSEHI